MLATFASRCLASPSLSDLHRPRPSYTLYTTPSNHRHGRIVVYSSPEVPDTELPPETDTSPDGWAVCKTLTQLWAIVLPLGYAVLPLTAQALSDVPGGASVAAAAVEAVALAGAVTLLRSKGFALPTFSLDPKAIGAGIGAGAAALAINQLLFSGGQADATADVVAVLSSGGPAAAALLYLASAVLAPATEELIYRGFFLGSLQRLGTPAPAAVAAAAAAFSVAHLQPAALPQLFVVGGALGAAAVACEGNLAAPFLGHCLYNSALFLSLLVGR